MKVTRCNDCNSIYFGEWKKCAACGSDNTEITKKESGLMNKNLQTLKKCHELEGLMLTPETPNEILSSIRMIKNHYYQLYIPGEGKADLLGNDPADNIKEKIEQAGGNTDV